MPSAMTTERNRVAGALRRGRTPTSHTYIDTSEAPPSRRTYLTLQHALRTRLPHHASSSCSTKSLFTDKCPDTTCYACHKARLPPLQSSDMVMLSSRTLRGNRHVTVGNEGRQAWEPLRGTYLHQSRLIQRTTLMIAVRPIDSAHPPEYPGNIVR